MQCLYQIYHYGLVFATFACLLISVVNGGWPERGIKCISCNNCAMFESLKERQNYSVPCDKVYNNCIKMIRKTGEVDRKCGKEYQCKPPDKLPADGIYAETHCCYCDNCNSGTKLQCTILVMITFYHLIWTLLSSVL